MKLESNTSEKNTVVRYLALAWVIDTQLYSFFCPYYDIVSKNVQSQESNLAYKVNLGKYFLTVTAHQVLTKTCLDCSS
jgi:hypothetical protein